MKTHVTETARAARAAPERIWIDGRRAGCVDARDRGFQYGDGLFETMRVRGHAVRLLEAHLRRLARGCRRLGLALPDLRILRRELGEAAHQRADGVLKLIVSRGSGARGYRPAAGLRATRVMLLTALPAMPAMRPLQGLPASGTHAAAVAGVVLRVCRTPLGVNPRLAGLKTLNRLESVLARLEWRDERVWEGLMLDADGHVVCGTMTNVFVRRARTLHTPLLDRCGVAGVMRGWVVARSGGLRLRVREGRMTLPDLAAADEIFLTNAVAGIVPVATLRIGRRQVRLRSCESAQRLRECLARV